MGLNISLKQCAVYYKAAANKEQAYFYERSIVSEWSSNNEMSYNSTNDIIIDKEFM